MPQNRFSDILTPEQLELAKQDEIPRKGVGVRAAEIQQQMKIRNENGLDGFGGYKEQRDRYLNAVNAYLEQKRKERKLMARLRRGVQSISFNRVLRCLSFYLASFSCRGWSYIAAKAKSGPGALRSVVGSFKSLTAKTQSLGACIMNKWSKFRPGWSRPSSGTTSKA